MEWIDSVLREVAELPDRNSPDGWPEAMLVTGAELRQIIVAHAPAEPVNARLLDALKLAECVYRKNVVNEGEPSSVLEAMQAAITAAEAQLTDYSSTVDRAWARFCGAFGDGPDAPYPGMIAAFETHYGQSFRDKEWRTEAACWAAAWSKATARAEAALESGRPTMAVWFGEMPESNGKMNWTAILYRRDGSLMDGVTIYRSEYKDRVRYEADRLRWLIGELERKPNILTYDAELIVEAVTAEPKPDAESAMTRADVLRLALEAGFTWEPINNIADPLERFATLVLEADDGPWKSAVIDQLVIAHILTAEHESDPLKAIQDLLAYNSDIAVDPRVSGAAAKLVERTKEACAKDCMDEARKWPYPSHGNAAASMCAKMIFDMRQK